MSSNDLNMVALLGQLKAQLAKAKYPRDWWNQRHDAIAMLHAEAPRLFTELVEFYRAQPPKR
jgi:hypothetical protein